MTTATLVAITYVSPVPWDWYPRVWDWLQEFPQSNRDDDGPACMEDLRAGRILAAQQGEQTWGVLADGEPVGFLSYAPINSRVGMTRGICFTRAVHGTGIPRAATARVLAEIFATGIRKLQAVYYTHNVRVATFLRSLGAVEEGLLRDQVTQHGRPVSMKVVAIFAPEEPCQRGD